MRRAAEQDAGIQMIVTTGDNFYMYCSPPPARRADLRGPEFRTRTHPASPMIRVATDL